MLPRVLALSLPMLVALAMLPVAGGSVADADRLSRINHIVVIYQENHSFDNLYGGWEGANGLRATPHHPIRSRSTRQGRGTPACCRTTLAPPRRRCRPPARTPPPRPRSLATLRTRRSPSTTTSRRRRPPARHRGVRRQRRPPRHRGCRAAAPGTWCTASTRSSTSSTAARRTGM
jgi:hypothetical protein